MGYNQCTPYGTRLEYPLWNYTQVGPFCFHLKKLKAEKAIRNIIYIFYLMNNFVEWSSQSRSTLILIISEFNVLFSLLFARNIQTYKDNINNIYYINRFKIDLLRKDTKLSNSNGTKKNFSLFQSIFE